MVANRRSGSHDADAVRDAVAAEWGERGIAFSWHAEDDLARALREALATTPDVAVAAGGDGTVNAVANAIAALDAGTAPALGVLPLGTFNFVARRYGIPADDPRAAAALIAAGRTRRIGAGVVNGHLFLNNCCFGLYTSLIDARERHKRRFGRSRVVAVLSALATLLQPHAREAVLLRRPAPHEERKLRASLVFIGANPLQLDQIDDEFAAEVERGALGFVALRGIDLGSLLRLAWGAWQTDATELDEVEAIALHDAEIIVRRRRLRCVIDGEVKAMATPLRIAWRADALALCCPQPEETTP